MSRPSCKVLVLVLIACAILPYLFGAGHPFVYDDHGSILENSYLEHSAHVLQTLTLKTLADPSIKDGRRPLVILSYFMDRALWGLNPWGYHLTNLLLHAVVVLFLFLLGRRLSGKDGEVFAAFAAAALYAVHPALSEAVQLPAFREDLLCTAFILLGGVLALRKEWIAVLLALLSLFLAGLSKELALAAPLLMAWVFFAQPAPREFGFRQGILLALSGILFLGFFFLWRQGGELQAWSADWNGYALRFPENLFTAPWLFLRYAGLMIAPFALSADHMLKPVEWLSVRFFLGLIFSGVWMWAAWRYRRKPLLAVGLGWFILAFLPVSNVVPLFNPMAERYLYLMAVGWALVLGWTLSLIPQRSVAAVLLALLCAVCVWKTVTRLHDWKDDATLWAAVRRVDAGSARAASWLGLEQKQKGARSEARSYFFEAEGLNPQDVSGLLNLAIMEGEEGRYEEAERKIREALSRQPRHAQAYWNLSVALRYQGRETEAMEAVRRTLEIDPWFVPARQVLGQTH